MPLLLCPCGKNAPMQPVIRNDVEIDICTQCRGVWLDGGELEKLLGHMREDRAQEQRPERPWQGERGEWRGHEPRDERFYKRKKKLDFLDFFD